MIKQLARAASAAGLIASPALAQSEQPSETEQKVERVEIRRVMKDGKTVEESAIPSDIRARVANCEGEKFEAAATSGEDKNKKRTRIVLCGDKDATTAETAAMLESAVTKLEANQDMPAENKAQIVAQLKAKIAELKGN